MSNDWKAFRNALENSGDIFSDVDAAKIPRVQRRNTNRWNHIRRIVMVIQKRDKEFVADAQLNFDSIYEKLLVISKRPHSVIYELDEFLNILYDIDQLEGEFDFEKGSTSEYVKRIKKAFAVGKQEYAWRLGKSKEDFTPPFVIGAPPSIPKKPEE